MADPTRILNRGPEYFRQRVMDRDSGWRLNRRSAVDLLQESKTQFYVSDDPPPDHCPEVYRRRAAEVAETAAAASDGYDQTITKEGRGSQDNTPHPTTTTSTSSSNHAVITGCPNSPPPPLPPRRYCSPAAVALPTSAGGGGAPGGGDGGPGSDAPPPGRGAGLVVTGGRGAGADTPTGAETSRVTPQLSGAGRWLLSRGKAPGVAEGVGEGWKHILSQGERINGTREEGTGPALKQSPDLIPQGVVVGRGESSSSSAAPADKTWVSRAPWLDTTSRAVALPTPLGSGGVPPVAQHQPLCNPVLSRFNGACVTDDFPRKLCIDQFVKSSAAQQQSRRGSAGGGGRDTTPAAPLSGGAPAPGSCSDGGPPPVPPRTIRSAIVTTTTSARDVSAAGKARSRRGKLNGAIAANCSVVTSTCVDCASPGVVCQCAHEEEEEEEDSVGGSSRTSGVVVVARSSGVTVTARGGEDTVRGVVRDAAPPGVLKTDGREMASDGGGGGKLTVPTTGGVGGKGLLPPVGGDEGVGGRRVRSETAIPTISTEEWRCDMNTDASSDVDRPSLGSALGSRLNDDVTHGGSVNNVSTSVRRRHKKAISRSRSDLTKRFSNSSDLSELSARFSRNSADLEKFFNEMGLDRTILDPMMNIQGAQSTSSLNLFDCVSSVGSPDTRSWGSEDSQRSDLGLKSVEVEERTTSSTSVVERNARIIKWLCSVKKAGHPLVAGPLATPGPPVTAPPPPPPPAAGGGPQPGGGGGGGGGGD